MTKFTDIKGTLASHSTKIDRQNAQQNSAAATKTEVDTLSGRVNTVQHDSATCRHDCKSKVEKAGEFSGVTNTLGNLTDDRNKLRMVSV